MYQFFLLILFLSFHVEAYLYQAVVMKRWDDLRDRYHYFIGLGDYHIKHASNQKQFDQFSSLVTKLDPKSFKMLTEDLSVANSDGKWRCGKFYVNSRGGFLGGITEKCRNMGCDADNLEYRYARVCSLVHFLNKKTEGSQAPVAAAAISVGDIVGEINHEIDRISSFNDEPVLKNCYQRSVEQVNKKIADYGLTDHSMSMADYIMSKKRNPTLINKLLTFDRGLLDAKIAHWTVNSTDKDRVCVLAGGSHIERVKEMLEKVGYKTVLELPKSADSHLDVESCVQSERIVEKNISIPEPIDLDELRRWL